MFSLAPDVLNALLREENGWDEFSQSLDSAYTALKDYQQVKDDPTQVKEKRTARMTFDCSLGSAIA